MAIKTFYLELSGETWLNTGKILRSKYGFEPAYWSADKNSLPNIRKNFPSTLYQDSMQATRGVPLPEFAVLVRPLDKPFIRRFSQYEHIVLGMMRRMDPARCFTHEERVRLYYRVLSYWSGVLETHQPDLVIFQTSPHVIFDYVVYCLCQEMNIPTVLIGMNSLSQIYAAHKIDEGIAAVKLEYNRGIQNGIPQYSLSNRAEKHFDYISKELDAKYLFTYRRYLDRIENIKTSTWHDLNWKGKLLSLPAAVIRNLRLLFNSAPNNYLKIKGVAIEHSHMTGFQWRFNRLRAYSYKRRLKRYYNKFVVEPYFNKPYIYVPLHYQPENTTSPLGDVYDDQLLIIKMLAKAIPKDWMIYVKEYPNQFDYYTAGERARDFVFYDDLRSIPQVRLLPLSANSFGLIDKSIAVATVTGSVGWESACRGKPVLAFGYPWYAGCEGVFEISSFEDCNRSLQTIRQGYKVDVEKVKYFLHVMDSLCLNGYSLEPWADEFDVSREENVNNLADCVYNAFGG